MAFTCSRTVGAGGNGNVRCPIQDRFQSNKVIIETIREYDPRHLQYVMWSYQSIIGRPFRITQQLVPNM